jgi:hypothetical protein
MYNNNKTLVAVIIRRRIGKGLLLMDPRLVVIELGTICSWQ